MPVVRHHPLVIFPPLKFTTLPRSRVHLGAGGASVFRLLTIHNSLRILYPR